MKKQTAVFCLASVILMIARTIWADAYTPIGAEAGGNPGGDIPAYEGDAGLTCPQGYAKGDFLPSPYANETPLFRIDASNVDQYQSRLSPGQAARIKRNKNFYMRVFPTHRNFTFPEAYTAATQKNRTTCRLDAENVLQGFNGGIPFPAPKNGLEAIWNIKKPWAGDDLISDDCHRIVSPSGKVKKSIWRSKIMAFDATRLGDPVPNPDGVSLKIMAAYTYPPDRAGEATLTVEYIDDNKETDIWMYMPSLRRVRRAPTVSKGMQIGGESTADEIGFDYRGPVNDWQWKLIGKKEMYIPANNYDIWEVDAPDSAECLPGDIHPERLRYELHRVWVVEGVLKEGLSHPYSRRVSYYDEDCWAPVAADRYDQRGNLWRMGEYFQVYNYCEKRRYVIGYMYLNLESGRYEVFGGCRTKDTKTNATNVGLKADEFTPQALQQAGR